MLIIKNRTDIKIVIYDENEKIISIKYLRKYLSKEQIKEIIILIAKSEFKNVP